MENTTEAKTGVYLNCESHLKSVINARATTENILFFVEALQDFKHISQAVNKPTDRSLNYSLSKEYLKNLVVGNNKQKSNKISKLLKKANLKTDLTFRYTTKRNGYGTEKSKEKINTILIN